MTEQVRVRDCACPGEPHGEEGDIVFLAPTLGFDGGFQAETQLLEVADEIPTPPGAKDAEVNRVGLERLRRVRPLWLKTFVRYGATGWNLLDDDGAPVPFDVEAILADYALARPVADAAADLYQPTVLAPFLDRQRKRSPTGPTPATTSRLAKQTRSRSG